MGKKRIIEKSPEEQIKEAELNASASVKTEPSRHKDARVCVFSSYNNTIITLTDLKGAVLGWSAAGAIGFKGTKKGTPFAASKVAEAIAEACKKAGISQIEVLVKGIGSGRESALRSLSAKGLEITAIRDVTPVPHNGCRPPKRRRV